MATVRNKFLKLTYVYKRGKKERLNLTKKPQNWVNVKYAESQIVVEVSHTV